MTAAYTAAGGVIPAEARGAGFGFLTSASLVGLARQPDRERLARRHAASGGVRARCAGAARRRWPSSSAPADGATPPDADDCADPRKSRDDGAGRRRRMVELLLVRDCRDVVHPMTPARSRWPLDDPCTRGGVVAYPTDTLTAWRSIPRDDACGRATVRRRRDAMRRAAAPADCRRRRSLRRCRRRARRRVSDGSRHAFWPGPLTIVVPARAAIARRRARWRHDGRACACPAHAVARALAAGLGLLHHRHQRQPIGRAAAPRCRGRRRACALGDCVDLLVRRGTDARAVRRRRSSR